MSKCNSYARRLDTAFVKARDEYTSAYEALKQAEQDRETAGQWFEEKYESERAAKKAKAEYRYFTTKAQFEEVGNRVWAELGQRRDELRTALQKDIRADGTASPDALDAGALELLKSGIMTPDDYFAFMDKFDDNPTMLRLVAKYAQDAADDTDNRAGQAALLQVVHLCKDGQGRVMRAWDDISKVVDYCSGQIRGRREDPAYIISMARRWEELTKEAIAGF